MNSGIFIENVDFEGRASFGQILRAKSGRCLGMEHMWRVRYFKPFLFLLSLFCYHATMPRSLFGTDIKMMTSPS
jgi:hypothetical protein